MAPSGVAQPQVLRDIPLSGHCLHADTPLLAVRRGRVALPPHGFCPHVPPGLDGAHGVAHRLPGREREVNPRFFIRVPLHVAFELVGRSCKKKISRKG